MTLSKITYGSYKHEGQRLYCVKFGTRFPRALATILRMVSNQEIITREKDVLVIARKN